MQYLRKLWRSFLRFIGAESYPYDDWEDAVDSYLDKREWP